MVSKTDLAYAAGIIDGEGCIQFYFADKRQYRLSVCVGTSDTIISTWLAEKFGGPIYHVPRYNDSTRYDIRRWHVWDSTAGKFLRAIFPYLKLKKEQARIGLKYCHIKSRFPRRHMSPGTKRQYERWHVMMRDLKKANKTPRTA